MPRKCPAPSEPPIPAGGTESIPPDSEENSPVPTGFQTGDGLPAPEATNHVEPSTGVDGHVEHGATEGVERRSPFWLRLALDPRGDGAGSRNRGAKAEHTEPDAAGGNRTRDRRSGPLRCGFEALIHMSDLLADDAHVRKDAPRVCVAIHAQFSLSPGDALR